MKKTSIDLVLLGACLSMVSAVGEAETGAAGHWEGKIQIPNHELGIAVDLAKNPNGVWIGSMSVLGATSIDVPLNSIAVESDAVRFKANLPASASFDARLSEDASSLSGTASNAEGEAPFQLARNGDANVKVPPPSSPLSKEFEGTWEGVIDVEGKVKRVGLQLVRADDGIATAKLIAVEQGNLEIPVTTVTIRDKQLQLESRAVSGTFRGTLGAEGEISGEWAQGPNRFPLTFKRVSPKAE